MGKRARRRVSDHTRTGNFGPIYAEPPGDVDAPERSPAAVPYRLITTTDPDQTFAEGEMSFFPTCLAAANAFVKSTAPYKTVVFDDGCIARELNHQEQRLLEAVCELLGYEVGEVGE